MKNNVDIVKNNIVICSADGVLKIINTTHVNKIKLGRIKYSSLTEFLSLLYNNIKTKILIRIIKIFADQLELGKIENHN